MQTLFRPEAVAHATDRLDGSVLLPTRVSVWILGVCVVAALALVTGFAAYATYVTKETIPGWLAPETGLVPIVAARGGMVSEMFVSEGDWVEVGAPLARVRPLAVAPTSRREQRVAQFERDDEYVVGAPVGGRVHTLKAWAGRAVSPGASLGVLVPDDAELVAELFVPTRAATFVKPGQPLRVKYEALPFERYGAHDALITEVSVDVLWPSETGVPHLELTEPVFRIRGRLADQELNAHGTAVPLRAGMLLTADIVVGRQTLIGLLTDPVDAAGPR